MRPQHYYTTAGPRRSAVPRVFLISLALLALATAIVGIDGALNRRGPGAGSRTPAQAERGNQVRPHNRIFADEILGAQQVARAAKDVPNAPTVSWPVVCRLPRPTPSLWRSCRACADEVLGEVRVPAGQRRLPCSPT
jgi:hypothetical protein